MNPPFDLKDAIEIEDMNEDTKVQILNRTEVLNNRLDCILEKIEKRKQESKKTK